ncbi:Cadmium, zinc and cobalt-transporting ATPase [bioreactor metagenome]|uniref:Cadmium, zinc and cobalt-transporting ATPase n=1 Tax=bioreactor metagenome TaxID=1076179 RepID=A0A644YSK5_9ZZZZ
MTDKQKKSLLKIIISALLLIALTFFPTYGYIRFFAYIIPYLIVGLPVLKKATDNISHGQVFDENFLMCLATIGALFIGEYPEAIFVMLFYQIGDLFETIAVGKSRNSISDLMNICPEYVNIERNGILSQLDPDEAVIGDIMVIKPGEKIPLDGTILEGTSSINTSALTGESLPLDVSKGDSIISGCININGMLKAEVTKEYSDSTVSKIIELVENSAENKAHTENFITRFARYYTPIVVISAVILAFVPPLITGGDFTDWLMRALNFLVVSCPCALVISVPLTYFSGIGCASKQGILIKGSNYLEALAKAKTVVFDKTGTLTKGSFFITEIHPKNISENKLIEITALAESFSTHPISVSIRNAYNENLDTSRVSDIKEISGYGVKALVDGKIIYVGNEKLMTQIGCEYEKADKGTIVHVAIEKEYAGYIVIADIIKEDSKDAISMLKAIGIENTVILSGDKKAVVEDISKELGIDTVYAELLPDDKVKKLEELINSSSDGSVAFVGDGINDAPSISRADIGIAMGAMGSDAAIEAADIVLMDDKPSKISLAVKIAKNTKKIVRQNIVFALTVKFIVLILSALGMSNMWEAVFADVGVSVLAILNSTRAMKIKYK